MDKTLQKWKTGLKNIFNSSTTENSLTDKKTEMNIPKGVVTKLDKVVSKEFLDIYSNFNVSSQIDKMNKLSKKELYLLLCAALDQHDYKEDQVVRLNLLEFENEIKLIHKMHNNEKHGVSELDELAKETCDSDINTYDLVDQDGNKLPKPKTKQEVREIRLNEITS